MKTKIKTFTVALTLLCIFAHLHIRTFAQVANGTGAGNCLNFDGTNDYVNVGTTFNPISGNGGNVTMESWVKYTGGGQYIFTKGNDNQANSYGILISGTAPAGLYACVMTFGSGAGYAARWACSPAGSISLNTWNHVVGVIQGSSMSLYLNGELAGSNTVSGIINTSTLPVWIGGQYRPSYYYYLGGDIDEVRIWNRALTKTEIQTNMCKKLQGNESGLVGYWRFDESSGGTAYDASPNGNNGTLY